MDLDELMSKYNTKDTRFLLKGTSSLLFIYAIWESVTAYVYRGELLITIRTVAYFIIASYVYYIYYRFEMKSREPVFTESEESNNDWLTE